MKIFYRVAIGVFFSLGLAVQAEIVSGISVVVNDSVITYGEIADRVEPRILQAEKLYGNNRDLFEQEARRVRDQQIDDLVERKLILHEFTSTGYVTNVLESFIDDEIKKKIQKEYYGDRARFISTLHAEGMTFEMYRRQEREDFIVNYMGYQNLDAPRKTLISPLKIEEYYNTHQDVFKVEDQVKLRMIVIAQSDSAPGEARRIATDVLAKINSGVPFDEMARNYSSGSHRSEGGDYGWVSRKDLKSELSDVAFSLKPKEHSGIIELPEGCYIMQIDDSHPAHIQTLPEVRMEIERLLRNEERARLHRQWIQRLTTKSFIRYY